MNYSTIRKIKFQSRKALENNWASAIMACFTIQLIPIIINMTSNILINNNAIKYYTYVYQNFEYLTPIPANGYAKIWIIFVFLINLIVMPSLFMGLQSYFLSIHKGDNPSWKYVFSQLPHWKRNTKLSVIQALFILLWSLLLVFPGIIAAINYALATYILIENPNLPVLDSIKHSKKTMYGKKMFFFLLYISFLGWRILLDFSQLWGGLLGNTLSQIGELFLLSYVQSTLAVFYLQNKISDNMK